MMRRLRIGLLASAALCLGSFLAVMPAAAQDATWLASPGDGDFNNAANWSPATVPMVSFGVGPTASFGASSVTAITMAIPGFGTHNIGGITLNSGASAYTIDNSQATNINGAGFIINGGSLTFVNNSVSLFFQNASTLGTATLVNNTFMEMLDTSTFGNGVVNNTNGIIQIFNSASAGNATINNIHGDLQFWQNTTGGNAAITNDATSSTTFFNHTGPISLGSIAGGGVFGLGATELTVGGNNLSTNVTGVIEDGTFGSGGSLVKIGTGTMTLSGINTYTGGTTISAGAISVSSDANLGDAAGGLTFNGGALQVTGTTFNATARTITWGAGGGTFDIANAANTFTVSQTLNGGQLTKSGAGTLTLAAANTFTGGVTMNAGTLNLGAMTQTTGTLTLSGGTIANGTLTGTAFNTQSGTISAVLAGSGALTQSGTGITILSGTNTYTGATTVNGGTLAVNGSILTSSGVTVNAGGTLMGTGIVGNTVVTGGTFAPGSGTAGSSMTVTGTLGLNAAATYTVNLNPSTSSFANVSGAATLGGAAVNASFANGSYIAKKYTMLTAGSISGTFGASTNTNLPTNFSSSLSYDATNAYLDLTLNFTPSPGLSFGTGLSGNQSGIANALINYFNANGGIPTVFGTMNGNGLSQASGQPGGSVAHSGGAAPGQFVNAIFGNAFGGGGSGGPLGFAQDDDEANAQTNAYAAKRKVSREAKDAYAAVTPRDVKAPTFEGRWSVFASIYGGNNRVGGDATAGTNTTTSRAYGTVVGADHRFTPATHAGFALGGAGSSFDIAGGFGSGKAEIFNAAVYGRHDFGAAYVAGALSYSWQDTTTDRTVTISGTDKLHASFKAQAFTARLEGGWRYATPFAGVTPYAAVQSTSFFLPAYGETATSGSNQFALSYAAKTTTNVRTELGAKFDRAMLVQGGVFTLTNRTAWAHDSNTDSSASATFQSLPGATFTSGGATPSPNAALISLGAEMKWHNGWSIAGLLDGEFSRTTIGYTGKGTVRYAW
jgi:autotransporter-associated beta strand protein